MNEKPSANSEQNAEQRTPPAPVPPAPDPARSYQVLTREVKQKDGTLKKVSEKFNGDRRDLKAWVREWEERTGKKCTPRQVKKLRRMARQQEILNQALEASVAKAAAKDADVGMAPKAPGEAAA